jgi:hypothetical protein
VFVVRIPFDAAVTERFRAAQAALRAAEHYNKGCASADDVAVLRRPGVCAWLSQHPACRFSTRVLSADEVAAARLYGTPREAAAVNAAVDDVLDVHSSSARSVSVHSCSSRSSRDSGASAHARRTPRLRVLQGVQPAWREKSALRLFSLRVVDEAVRNGGVLLGTTHFEQLDARALPVLRVALDELRSLWPDAWSANVRSAASHTAHAVPAVHARVASAAALGSGRHPAKAGTHAADESDVDGEPQPTAAVD